jgi:ABC-type Fe3+-hydroxamate transport system substrate-binding protein
VNLYSTAILACVALAGCHARDDRAAAPRAVKRVVSLAASTTEILFAVGAGDLIVGVDRFSDFPPPAKQLPSVGSELGPSVERIVALRPDVVFIASSANGRELGAELERLHLRVFASHADTLEDVFADIRHVGAAIGREAQAAALEASLRARVAAVSRAVADKPRPRALVVVWTDPLTVAGGKSFVHDALVAAGGDDVAADSPLPYPQYSVERLLSRAPAVIVIGSRDGSPAPAPLMRFASLPAVRDGRVHQLDADLLFRPGPRLVDGIEALARVLHP